jgi:hypothetical protein
MEIRDLHHWGWGWGWDWGWDGSWGWDWDDVCSNGAAAAAAIGEIVDYLIAPVALGRKAGIDTPLVLSVAAVRREARQRLKDLVTQQALGAAIHIRVLQQNVLTNRLLLEKLSPHRGGHERRRRRRH